MTIFTRETSKLLKAFHGDVNSRASKVGAGVAGLRMLQQQLGVYENIINDLATTVKGTINTTQKDINREFTPVIEKAMTAAYDACVAEAGMYLQISFRASSSNARRSRELCADEIRDECSCKSGTSYDVSTERRRGPPSASSNDSRSR